MKILIAYDGSDEGDVMLNDLPFAGLPAEAEAIVITAGDDPDPCVSPAEFGHSDDCRCLDSPTYQTAMRACERIKKHFPGWTITPEAVNGAPAELILGKADDWLPDLIIVGTHSRTAVGRFFLGSVSRRIMSEARCSVRVCRGGMNEILERCGIGLSERSIDEAENIPARIIVCLDGSLGSVAAAEAVIARRWPPGTSIHLITSISDPELIETVQMRSTAVSGSTAAKQCAMLDQVLEIHNQLEGEFRAAGYKTSSVTKEVEPQELIVDQAERWGADMIFLGATGLGAEQAGDRLDQFIGSVSDGVCLKAYCTVEIVREG